MVPSEENQLVPKEVESAAEEPRVLCIIQDTTNSKTVNERVTLNLPASTPLKRLFEDVASKVGYVNGTFDLVWGNGDNVTDTTPIDQNSDKTILDAGFEPGKKNFLHLTDKDGEQPHIMPEESGTTDDSAQDRLIGPLPREGSVGCTNDYVSQSYSYSSVLSKSETAPGCSLSACTMIPGEVHPPLPGSPPASRDSLWKRSAALPRREVPGQVLGGCWVPLLHRARQQVTAQ